MSMNETINKSKKLLIWIISVIFMSYGLWIIFTGFISFKIDPYYSIGRVVGGIIIIYLSNKYIK